MINDKRQRTKDKRRKTKDKRRKTSQRLSLDIRHKKMKKHLLIITALFLSATSCRSTKEVTHRADTVYIAQRQYDSVIIDRYTTTENKGDTVLVDRLTTEYRYRLSTDTLHNYHTDTITVTIVKEASNKNYDMLPWVMVVVLIVGVVIKAKILRNP